MTGELESAIRNLLKSVLLDVAYEVLSSQPSGKSEWPRSDTPNEQMLLRSSEAAKLLDISERHLFAMTRSGMLPCVHIGRLVRYSPDTIREWIRQAESTMESKQDLRASRQPSPAKMESQNVVQHKTRTPKKLIPQTKMRERQTVSTPADVAPRSQRGLNRGAENRPRSAIAFFADRLGVAEDALPRMTNGELRRIAGVDIPTLHGWQYLNRDLPEAAVGRLHEYFAKYLGRQH